MRKSIENLKHSLEALEIDKVQKVQLIDQLKAINKELIKSDFKAKKTLQDKQTVTRILNRTIETLEEQREALKKQKAKEEELLKNVSHELRTPLNAVIGMGALLVNTNLDTRQQLFVNTIKIASNNLLIIINELLQLFKLNADNPVKKNSCFQTRQLLGGLNKLVADLVNPKELELIFDIDEDVPLYLISDYEKVREMLIILLSNSIKFTTKGKITLETQVLKIEQDCANIIFLVKDTGLGMSITKRNDIRAYFEQNDNEIRQDIGIGLCIVKRFVSKLNGQITLDSTEGVGTTVRVVLPFKIGSEKDYKAQDNHIEQQFVLNKQWDKKKILYIEDNNANILYLEQLFKYWKCPIYVARNLKEATRALNSKQFDCIISDVQLPDGNGMNLIESLRNDEQAINQNTPVMILTAHDSAEDEEKSERLEFLNYLKKPILPESLLKHLNVLFGFNNKEHIMNEHNELIEETSLESNLPHLFKLLRGDKKNMLEMINIFLEQLPKILLGIEEALSKSDWKKMHYYTHTIKSSLNIMGLMDLKNIAGQIENISLEQKSLEEIPALVKVFKEQAIVQEELVRTERKKLLNVLGY